MKKLKFVVVLLLCAIIFAACGGSDADVSPTTGAGGNENGEESPAENGGDEIINSDEPNIPGYSEIAAIDMSGRTFTFLTQVWLGTTASVDIAMEEEWVAGDPIDDAALNRKIKIEEKYNVTFNQVVSEGSTDNVNRYENAVLAGDDIYDIAITAGFNFFRLLAGGYMTELSELAFIDVAKPYWNRNFYDAMSLVGRHFTLDGSISKRSLECVWIMAFNKQMIQDNQMESPFALVKEGKWTYDKMHEMGRAVARDLNGDGLMTLEDDLWGINYTGYSLVGIINSSGVRFGRTDDRGYPEITIGIEPNPDRLLKIYETMMDNSYSIDTYYIDAGWGSLPDVQIFGENRCLFLATSTNHIAGQGGFNLRALDTDFGIIPYPKWNDGAPHHIPFTEGVSHPMLSIPITNRDLESTSIILEAMAYEGHNNIIPEFYESLLMQKTVRDNESAEMINFIFNNIQYDVGNMFNFGDMLSFFRWEMATNLNMNIVSQVERRMPVWEREMNGIVETVENN